MTEEIVVTIPRERPFGTVAGLVLGGVAARHELTVEALDDLQLALETLLDREAEGNVSVILRVESGTLDALIGPFDRATVAELEHRADDGLGLRRMLDTFVDRVALRERDGECWVELRKAYDANAAKI